MHLSLITQRTIVYQVQLRNGIVQPTLLLGNLNQQQARIGSVGDGATGLVIYRLSALSLHFDVIIQQPFGHIEVVCPNVDLGLGIQQVEIFGGMPTQDRKSVVKGKSVSVRVDLGGRRIIKK